MGIHLFELRRDIAGPGLGSGTGRAVRKGRGPPLLGRVPLPVPPELNITGITRDGADAPLGNCEVELYTRSTDQTFGTYVARTVSDGGGTFSFRVGPGQVYQHIAYKAGSPNVAGISDRTLVGT